MHWLGREVRFSVNPFLKETEVGDNSYCGKPSGQGLAVYLALLVELAGEAEADTGFVVNVTEIDRAARERAAVLFEERIRQMYGEGRHVGTAELVRLLEESGRRLSGSFGGAQVSRLGLALNPARRIAIDTEDDEVYEFSEKFEFAAMHKLWNESFSAERNFEVFGKCANPTGHGHNYVLEVTVSCRRGEEVEVGRLERAVNEHFIELVDHKNLNVDVAGFEGAIPTVENIARLAWERLEGRFGSGRLSAVTVWETDKTYCRYRGA